MHRHVTLTMISQQWLMLWRNAGAENRVVVFY
jgi:hypothetical protein